MDEEEMMEYTNSITRDGGDGEELSALERAVLAGNLQLHQDEMVPPWRQQLTMRAMVVSFFLGILFTIIVLKLVLTTGFIPTLNPSAGFLAFFFLKVWTVALQKPGLLRQPFTPQENTVIQTCVAATSTVAYSGGFGSSLLAMSKKIVNQTVEANAAQNIKDPHLGWMIAFLFVVSFLGLFSLLPLTKVMIIDYKLVYPSGTATARLINSFHTPHGTKLERKQVNLLGKFLSFSFLWGLFQWFYTAGKDCGFENFPLLGLRAYKNRFYFDFSATYIGTGMICSHLVNISALLGGIISWGIMWPLIENKEGDWYPANLDAGSLGGIQGYRVFISVSMILGVGLYIFVRILYRAITVLVRQQVQRKERTRHISDSGDDGKTAAAPAKHKEQQWASSLDDDQRRTELFMEDQIPLRLAYGGYVAMAAISVVTLPRIFPEFKWYHALVVCSCAPVLSFCNAYGCGLTDWSLESTYGKLAIFVVGTWAGAAQGGVLAGLAACCVVMTIVTTACDLMQDFRTGYLTMASPRSMFVSHAIGTARGCVISPCVFWLFYHGFDVGTPGTEYSAPFAPIYLNMAILGAEGFGWSLPKHCLTLCYAFFSGAVLLSFVRDVSGESRVARFVPIPMAMAIPFYFGPYFTIDMCVGTLILYVWQRVDGAKAEAFGPAVASGLICGAGIWTLPESMLSLANVKPPICMKFLSRRTNESLKL